MEQILVMLKILSSIDGPYPRTYGEGTELRPHLLILPLYGG